MLFSLCRCLQTRFHFQLDLYNLNRLELQRLENIFLFSVEKGNLWRKSVENIYREVKGRTHINIKKIKKWSKNFTLNVFALCSELQIQAKNSFVQCLWNQLSKDLFDQKQSQKDSFKFLHCFMLICLNNLQGQKVLIWTHTDPESSTNNSLD